FHTIVSIKNDGHYFCRAGGNRPDGLNEPVTSFQRSVMNTRALFPLLFTVASFSASAGNWAVKNGWCQTMTEDGQALVML
ncbi:hypothetical protein FCX76_25915, partial [Escherichia coli]|nr:hypothetical protein [Escherichia coli]MDN0656350.1 hypothetical protein [Escherichia coli]MDN0661266.1 hypothetical protein [Escherichia coli]MDN0671094.1 hypothetical protein [Escherichia coli]MDN0675997.1 hypothetical protein [Escherichia coli]